MELRLESFQLFGVVRLSWPSFTGNKLSTTGATATATTVTLVTVALGRLTATIAGVGLFGVMSSTGGDFSGDSRNGQ